MTPICPIYKNPLILSINPNFQRDIQVEPPLKKGWEVSKNFGMPFSPQMWTVLDWTLTGKAFFFKGWFFLDLGVSKNRDAPKWMVYNGKPY